MTIQFTPQFPSYFVLQDITNVTGTHFELKRNPNRQAANEISEKWLEK
jgi:hypothetical protein